MEIKTRTRIDAVATTRLTDEASFPEVTGNTGQRVALSNVVCSVDEDGVSFSGFGYQIIKATGKHGRSLSVSAVDPAELPDDLKTALVTAANEALSAAIVEAKARL